MADESNIASQFQKAVADMTATQKGMVAAISLTVILVLAGIGMWASQDSMGVLFSNLPPADANRIVEELKKSNTKYELSTDQRTVSVPENRVGDLRLKFAGDGLPKGEGIGFEKLENPSLTTTDFTQKIMYRRALEQHLAKTIMSLQQVSEAVVHITPTNDSPFVTEKEDAKASVLLKLKGTKLLPEENTQAIVNLVAASVEGLKPEQVVIIDQFSRILSRSGKDPMTGATDSQKKAQREEEDHLVQRVTELLEPVVGLGRVRATARVDLDFDKVRTNEEKFDPQGQVERETKVLEEHETKREGGNGGQPGTPTNVAPATGGAAPGGTTDVKDKKETNTHFEISKIQSSTEKAPGTVRRMSIAVIVDHASTWTKDAKGEPVEKLSPRTPEELKKIREQVSSAVGFLAKRGDELTVENLPFASMINPKAELEMKQAKWVSLGQQLVWPVLYFILGLVIFFLVVLPLLKRVSAALSQPTPLRVRVADGEGGEGGSSPRKFTPLKSVSELEAEIEAELNAEGASSAPEAQRRGLIKKRIQESTLADAETVASLVRSWMIEDGR
jgi:flagellar M-ring protein FliF